MTRERTLRLPRSTGPVALVVVGVVVVLCVLLLACGIDPVSAGAALLNGALGTGRSVGESLVRITPLLLIAVTLAPSLRARVFNLGAPGQMAAGALAATVVGLTMPDATSPLIWIASALAAAAAGLSVACVPALMRARWGVNEIISSIAMNFIVLYLLQYLLAGPMRGATANSAQSEALPAAAWLPTLVEGSRAHWGLVLAVVAVGALILLDRTRRGYRMELFAHNATLARQAGVKPRRMLFTLILVAGLGAGLAGWLQVAAVDHRLYPTIADPVGYAGLFVALLGAVHPIGMLISAVLMGVLLQGGDSLQVGAGIAPEVVQVVIGLVLLAYAVISGVAMKGNA